MSFPPTVIIKAAKNVSSREGQAIKIIVAHDTERPSNDSNSINYLVDNPRQVSVHALIEPDGTIYEMVPDAIAANHAGYSKLTLNGVTYSQHDQYSVNCISLGFELEYTKAPYNGSYPETQLLSMGWWICQKRTKYGNLPIYRHAEIDTNGKTDTRNLSVAEIEHWVSKAQMMLDGIPTPEKPIMYRFRVPQVVYTDRSITSRFAGAANTPVVYQSGVPVPIGDITDNWSWIATGVGFVPSSTLVKV